MIVQVSAAVLSDLGSFDPDIRERIVSKLDILESYPNVSGVKSLKGFHKTFRLRMGDYRAVFIVDNESKIIKVLAIGHRKDIYKKFIQKFRM